MPKRFSLFAIFTVTFSGSLGFSLVIPFLVVLVTRFGGDAFVYGVVGALYAAFQFFGAPLLGKWSDRYGRKPILLLSQLGTLLGWIVFFSALFIPVTPFLHLFGFILTLPLCIMSLARMIDGLTGGNIAIAQAYIADISSEKDRNRDYGRFSLSSNLGFIVGPALSGMLGATLFMEKLPVLAAIILSLFTFFFILFFLPESHTKRQKQATKIPLRMILTQPEIAYLLLLYFLIYIGFSFFYTAFPVHAIQKLHWSVTKMGIFFSILSALMVLVQGPILSFLSKRYPEILLMITGTFFLVITFLLLLSFHDTVVFSSALFFALGNGIMWPSLLSLLSKKAGPAIQGNVQGISASMGSLASILGLIGGGILYNTLGINTFALSAFTMALVCMLCLKLLFNRSTQ